MVKTENREADVALRRKQLSVAEAGRAQTTGGSTLLKAHTEARARRWGRVVLARAGGPGFAVGLPLWPWGTWE